MNGSEPAPAQNSLRGFWSLFATQFQAAFSDNVLKVRAERSAESVEAAHGPVFPFGRLSLSREGKLDLRRIREIADGQSCRKS